MSKIILVHANCMNPKALGDFVFAANLANEIRQEIMTRSITDIEVVLITDKTQTHRFLSTFPSTSSDIIQVDGQDIKVTSLAEFNPVKETVLAFIDANRCRHAPAEQIKSLIAPETKFIFLGNANQPAIQKTRLHQMVAYQQPGLYDSFQEDRFLFANAGFGPDRIGLAKIEKRLTTIPPSNQGFLYLSTVNGYRDLQLIAQYTRLTKKTDYFLIGEYETQKANIALAISQEPVLDSETPAPIHFEVVSHLAKEKMHETMQASPCLLVASTGISSTLEVMREDKLPFYQYQSNNLNFVKSYLNSIKDVLSVMLPYPEMNKFIGKLADLLFAPKPLSRVELCQTHNLLKRKGITSHLIQANQKLLDQASGRMGPTILNFVLAPSPIHPKQIDNVCESLKKPGEMIAPSRTVALRRAAYWGKLYELKILIKVLGSLDDTDPTNHLSALHYAVKENRLNCVQLLLENGANPHQTCKLGKTPRDYAFELGHSTILDALNTLAATDFRPVQ